ncbi:MAG: fumarate reductase subunit FrdD [Armatimonadota bacterium]|nr:fumarate reductase subunit FrdD [Armatimonadota bacterium]MDR7535831.1 fumarate reductase subunit FrdD [Armatimonadota bacterium]
MARASTLAHPRGRLPAGEVERSTEPLWWLLFASGGTVAALVLPVHALLHLGLALGLAGDVFAYDRVARLAAHPLGRLYLTAVVALALFHWAHRFRYTLAEGLRLKASWVPIPLVCYGAALLGVALTVLRLFFP